MQNLLPTKPLQFWTQYKHKHSQKKKKKECNSFLSLPFPLIANFDLVVKYFLPAVPSGAPLRAPAATSSRRSRGTCSSWARWRQIRWRSTGYRKLRQFIRGSLCWWCAGWFRPESRSASGSVFGILILSWIVLSPCFRFGNFGLEFCDIGVVSFEDFCGKLFAVIRFSYLFGLCNE